MTRRVRDLTPEIKAGLIRARQLRDDNRPPEEIRTALDAVAAMPGADHPDATELIEQLGIVSRPDADDAEVERVIQEYPADLGDWIPPSEQFLAGQRHVLWLASSGWPYDEIVQALDELEARPEAQGYEAIVMRDRLIIARWDDRPDAEIDELLQRALVLFAGEHVRGRLGTIASTCADRPALAARYVPGLLAELEEDLRQNPDQVGGHEELAAIKRSYERTMAASPASP